MISNVKEYKTQLLILIAISLWASAFVGIRAGLQDFSPEGLALLRYLIASACMALIYVFLPHRQYIPLKDKILLMSVGIVGIGIYNVALNYGEINVSSSLASFLIGQTPLISVLFAILFLGEKIRLKQAIGFLISLVGVIIIAMSEETSLKLGGGFLAMLIAVFAGASYSVLQKPFLNRYPLTQTISYVIWGATIFLCTYAAHLREDLTDMTWHGLAVVSYLGVFPAVIAYLAWGYGLSRMPTGRIVSYLYATPLIATLMGWFMLNEVPSLFSFVGGMVSIVGVWIVNQPSGSTSI